MLRRLLKESLIVVGGTLFFLTLAATIGIPGDQEDSAPTAEAAYEGEHVSEDLDCDRDASRKLKDFPISPLVD